MKAIRPEPAASLKLHLCNGPTLDWSPSCAGDGRLRACAGHDDPMTPLAAAPPSARRIRGNCKTPFFFRDVIRAVSDPVHIVVYPYSQMTRRGLYFTSAKTKGEPTCISAASSVPFWLLL